MRFLIRVVVLFAAYWIGYSHIGPTPEKILTDTTSVAVQTYVAAKPYVIVGKDIVGRAISKELKNTQNPFDGATEW